MTEETPAPKYICGIGVCMLPGGKGTAYVKLNEEGIFERDATIDDVIMLLSHAAFHLNANTIGAKTLDIVKKDAAEQMMQAIAREKGNIIQ